MGNLYPCIRSVIIPGTTGVQKTSKQIWTPQVQEMVISHVSGLWQQLGGNKSISEKR